MTNGDTLYEREIMREAVQGVDHLAKFRAESKAFHERHLSELVEISGEFMQTAFTHSKDEDCVLDGHNCCVVCGVYHGDPCETCGGRGFHKDGCKEA
jgi:hypothetical protein